MARYSYPIHHDDKGHILGVGTSAQKAVDLIAAYAEKLSNQDGNPAYGTTVNGAALKERIAEDRKVEVQLLAHDGQNRKPNHDEFLKVEKVEVNAILD